MPYRRTPTIQARILATRERILDAGHGLVATAGWEALTVAGVARAAEVATGSVYRHVDSKDALCAEVFRRAAGRELAHVATVISAGNSVRQRTEAGLRVFAERALAGRRLAYALLVEPAGPAVEVERLAYRQGYRNLFRDVFAQGAATGELAPHDPDVVAAALVGAMSEALVGPLAPAGYAPRSSGEASSLEEVIDCCLRMLPLSPESPEAPDALDP